MLRKYSFRLGALPLCLTPLHTFATINDSVKLTLDPGYSFYKTINIQQDQVLFGLYKLNTDSFTEQVSLHTLDGNYELTELFQYPEPFDAEVGVSFLHVDGAVYSIAWEGVYHFDMEANTANKIPLPELVTPTETLTTFEYDYYYQSFPRKTAKHVYVYESAVWNENIEQTLAKISRIEGSEFVDYFIEGFANGARTTEPSVHELGLIFNDNENLYLLPDDGDLLSYPIPPFNYSANYTTAFGSIIYPSSDNVLSWIHRNEQNNIVQEVLIDLNTGNEVFLGFVTHTSDNSAAFITEDAEGTYRIHQVTNNGLLTPIDVASGNTEVDIRLQIKNVYLSNDQTFGFIRSMDSFWIFNAETGEIQDPDNRFELEDSAETAFSFGDAILVMEKQSQHSNTLTKLTFIDNKLNATDVTDQVDSSIGTDCLFFSYFGENGYLNSQVISRCPAEGHYVVTDFLELVQTPAERDENTSPYSRRFFEFNKLRHSITRNNTGVYDVLSWHGSNDFDLDGVPDTDDAFPEDLNESVDTDSDGIGNNADTDDDNDGIEDINDPRPLIPEEVLLNDVVESSGGSVNFYLTLMLLISAICRRKNAVH